MKCLNCNKEFKAKRADAKFCSAKCRKLAFLKNGTDKLERLNDTDKRTDNDTDRIGKVIKGYCHGCGQDFTKIKGLTTNGSYLTQEQADINCICLKCLNKGITHKSLGIPMC